MLPDDLEFEAGVFWDRNESLMASLIVAGPAHPERSGERVSGLLKLGAFKFGVYAEAGYYDGLSTGGDLLLESARAWASPLASERARSGCESTVLLFVRSLTAFWGRLKSGKPVC